MAFKDRPMRCNACNHRFFYTVAEQRKRSEMGMHDHTMLFCTRCKSADVAEVELTGFNPSPRESAPPKVESRREKRPAEAARPVHDDSTDYDEDVEDERQEAPADSESSGGRDSDRRERREGGGHKGQRSRGGGRSRGRGGRGGGGRGGNGRGGKRGGGGGGRGRRRAPARQTELRVRHLGTIKWFDDDRGYGFIAQDEGGEVFIHLTGLIVEGYETLLEGTPVEFEIERTARGPQAVDVVPLA